MQLVCRLSGVLADAERQASHASDLGFDAVSSSEAAHDPFLPLALAAHAAPRLGLHTAIAVALARSPMVTAAAVRALHEFSGGNVVLGLGAQTKPHVERRFSMPWSNRPAAQMKEYVGALRAIWRDWEGLEPLRFEGEYYRHTLMTDTFRPGVTGLPLPLVHLAAVGPAMTRLAGECFDGLIPHSFSTSTWFREVTMPAVREGLERAGRERAELAIHAPGLIIIADPEEHADAETTARHHIAFYGSTPAYADVLRLHGWGDLHETLHRLSITEDPDRWARMADLIDGTVVREFAMIGTMEDVCFELQDRFGSEIDVLHLSMSDGVTVDQVAAARSATRRSGARS